MKKILLVEDTRNLRNALKMALTRGGFEVSEARDGVAALDELKQEKFDLIITDVVMPRKDGLTLLAEMREQKMTVPSIVISNVSREGEKRLAQDLGISAYFVKVETQLETLVEYVKMLLAN